MPASRREDTKPAAFLRRLLALLHALMELVVGAVFRLVYGKAQTTLPPIRSLLLLESASAIALKIRQRKLTSTEVVTCFIDRIKEINPALNCVVDERFQDALAEAAECDEALKAGKVTAKDLEKEKPFFGVPFTTKDCIAIKGLIWTAGLHCRKHIKAQEDADAIAKLRAAGAIPLGLTNVSELCMWWESSNTVHGRSNNPYDTNRIVGGSSGGEGCLQAAGGSAFGVGSDIGGSIRMPACFNGVFGHKPSKFVVSIKGQYPVPYTREQTSFLGVGPMCRRAEDLRPLLRLMAGPNAPQLRLDEPVDIRKVRFFYQENDMGGRFVSPVRPEIRECLRKAVHHLKMVHKLKPHQLKMERFNKSLAMWLANMSVKNAPTFSQQLCNLQGDLNVWLELAKWPFRLSNHTLIGILTSIVEKMGVKPGTEKHRYLVQERDRMREELEELLGQDGVLLYPTHPTPAPYHNEPLFKAFNFGYTGVVNILGFPATHCPMGLSPDGLPIGLQVVAATNQDRLCLAVAEELEKAFGGWVPPTLAV